MRFLENLDYLLTMHKLSRAELARQIDIAPSTINAWYTKDYKGISLKNLVKLSNFFNVTIEDLVYNENIGLVFTSWIKDISKNIVYRPPSSMII